MKQFTRRQSLALGLGGLTTLALPALHLNRAIAQTSPHHGHGSAATTSAHNTAPALPHPTLLQQDKSGLIRLKIAKGQHSFTAGKTAVSAGVNGSYFGPVVRLNNRSDIRMHVENAMDEATTLHWHGLMIPSDMDGGPHNVIAPGSIWQPEFHLDQPAAFNWFHAHMHHNTARQTHLGIAGMIHLSDQGDRERGLPDRFGIDDLFLAFQDRRVIEGDAVYQPDIMDLMHGFRGPHIAVNGAIAPLATVPQGIIRLRLLNASNSRNYHYHFSDGRIMHVIASDSGFITKPVAVDILTVSPGERYEVLVNFGYSQSKLAQAVDLVSLPDDGSGKTPQLGDIEASTFEHLMRFEVTEALPVDVTTQPAFLQEPAAADPAKALRQRSFLFDENMAANMAVMMGAMPPVDHSTMDHSKMTPEQMSQMMGGAMDHSAHAGRTMQDSGPVVSAENSGITTAIAGKPFNLNRVDVEVKQGSLEIWKLKSVEMGHPFHIHGAMFRILSKNGQPIPDHQAGWKDVALVDGEAELLIHFKAQAKRSHPFMFHCHILEHEDTGMMGQFITT